MKIINKARFLAFVVISLFLIVSIVAKAFQSDFKVIRVEKVVADRGDTVWGLLHRYNKGVIEQGAMDDAYDAVDKLNGRHVSDIYEDEVIKVPILALND